MSPAASTAELLRWLAAMPFLDRLELLAVSGWSRGVVYEGVRRLEQAGLAASVPHATELTAPTRRFHLTAAGVRVLAQGQSLSEEELLRRHPVSAQWQRILLARLDGAASIYRLACAVSEPAWPIGFRWYRGLPLDAAIALPCGRCVGVVRVGRSADRTGLANRLWRLRAGSLPGAVLLLLPDEVRLRHARGLLAGFPVPAVLALEREAVDSPAGAIWHLPSVNAAIPLGAVLDRAVPHGVLPEERPLTRSSPPNDLAADAPERDAPTCLLPALLRPAEKHALDLLADWPWLSQEHLQALLGVSRARTAQITSALRDHCLAARVAAADGRLVLTERGLTFIGRRDRTSVGLARKRWSAVPLDGGAAGGWRDVAGRRSRQLLRNIEHTAAVHGFIAALATQSRSLGWDLVQLDPPHRASRYFRRDKRLRSVLPDAFAILRRGRTLWPCFVEWERRAVRPGTMAAKLAPYLRYYATPRPTDDHGAEPTVLVVFGDELAARHFLRVAREQMERSRIEIPLRVSDRGLLERNGPLGPAWLTPGGDWEPTCAFGSR
ncbi:MAG: replication-relaxation family protein [Chloroflexi bacterium]|nr:replication-relaxation family protein [Chloroflexota bacterium]